MKKTATIADHPAVNVNVLTNFHGSLSDSCQDISLKIMVSTSWWCETGLLKVSRFHTLGTVDM